MMMSSSTVHRLDPVELGPPSPSYSQANIAGGFVFLAGQAALDEQDRVIAPGDTYRQTRVALERTERLLKHAGSDLEHVVSAQVFITPEADFDDFNRAWKEVFGAIRPGRTTAVTGLVIEGCLVEFVFTAALA